MSSQVPIRIREYDITDFSVLSHLVAEFFTFHRQLENRGPLPPEEAATIIPRDMLNETSHILVAEPLEGGDIIGFCRIEKFDEAFFLREIMVTEKSRIQGVGTALLKAAEEYLKAAGDTNLHISIIPRNIDALRFFVRRGYDIVNTLELRTSIPKDQVQRTPIHFFGLQFRY
ncbi:MAG: GNAT family N-acetyltransferase [Candidatus Thorarchaeota archaeon]